VRGLEAADYRGDGVVMWHKCHFDALTWQILGCQVVMVVCTVKYIKNHVPGARDALEPPLLILSPLHTLTDPRRVHRLVMWHCGSVVVNRVLTR
jgi:hypothetical protein